MRDSLAAALGVGVIAFVAVATEPAKPRATKAMPPAPEVTEVVPVAVSIAQVDEPAQPLHSLELQLLLAAGDATYMKLDVDVPKHGKPKLLPTQNYEEIAIATVADADVPAEHRAWKHRKVIVDGRCETTVVGFAVIARLTGDTGYAGTEDTGWTASNVMNHGEKVLAAKLAGCQGVYARDAALPAIIVPRERRDDQLAARARAKLAASAAGQRAQADWTEAEMKGTWQQAEELEWNVRVLEHPSTGVTWVVAHAMVPMGCGDPEVNLFGLYRVGEAGALETVSQRKHETLWSIETIIDVDNDGNFELLGRPWLALDTVLVRSSGEELERLSLPFYGCPC